MAWCPNCKLEYVEGVKICPDCKNALVESLEKYEAEEQEELEGEALEQVMYPGMQMELPDEETRKELYELAKKIKENPPYKSKEEQLNTNKSGAGVLIVCGVLGILILLLNSLGILNLPMQGFSKILMTAVMGCLFIVFLLTVNALLGSLHFLCLALGLVHLLVGVLLKLVYTVFILLNLFFF